MRTVTQTKTYYDKADCEALDNMSIKQVVDILQNLEGGWLPGRPSAYYSLIGGSMEEAELDFGLLEANKAIDLAAKWLKELDKAKAAEGQADAVIAPKKKGGRNRTKS